VEEAGPREARHLRACVKGVSVLIEKLPYLSSLHAWLMPVAHALLYGVVQKFVQTIMEGREGHQEALKVRCITLPSHHLNHCVLQLQEKA
jgi:hypothetical protein